MPRCFSTGIPWATRCWEFFRHHRDHAADVYRLAGDEVVVRTAGPHPAGRARFFSSLDGKPGPGLAGFTLSLVRTQERCSFPMCVEQVGRSAAANAASTVTAAARKQNPAVAKRRPGRPQGGQNTPQAAVPLTPECWPMSARRDAFLPLVAGDIPLTSWGLDGHFGTRNALPMARQGNWPLISKRRGAAALSFPSRGPEAGRGPHRKDGPKGEDDNRPGRYLKETTVEGPIQTRLSQARLLHKACAHPLKVVMSATTPRQTQARAHVLLFSRDLERADAPLVDDDG